MRRAQCDASGTLDRGPDDKEATMSLADFDGAIEAYRELLARS